MQLPITFRFGGTPHALRSVFSRGRILRYQQLRFVSHVCAASAQKQSAGSGFGGQIEEGGICGDDSAQQRQKHFPHRYLGHE